MGFGDACINILLLTQSFLDSPVLYDTNTDKVVANPKLHQNPWRMYSWWLGNGFIASVHVFSTIHLALMLKNFDLQTSSKAAKEEAFVYLFTVCITAQALLTCNVLTKNGGWIAGVEAQIFKATNIKRRGWPSAARRPDIFEAVAYNMAIGFFLFPFSAIVLPIIRSYDPINQMFEMLFPISVHPKVQRGIVLGAYLWSVFFGALSCLNAVLLAMTHCMALSVLSKENLTISKQYLARCPSILRSRDPQAPIKVNNFLTYVEYQNLQKFFKKRLSFYNQFRYMISGVNVAVGAYIPASVGVGMVLCIASNYGIIELFGRLPRIMEACMIGTTIGFSGLILNLMLFAATPLTNSENLAHFWQKIKMGRLQRRQIRTLQPVGFAMGEYFSIKRRTALDVMDTILNCTISVLMG